MLPGVCPNGAWRDYRRSGLSTDHARFLQRRFDFHLVVREARRGFWSDWQEQVEELRRRDPRVCNDQIRRCFRHPGHACVPHELMVWSANSTPQARRIITLILAPSGGDISQKSPCVKTPISTRVSLQQSAISSVHAVLTSHQTVVTPHSLSLSL